MSTEKRKSQRQNRAVKQARSPETASRPGRPWGTPAETHAYGSPEQIAAYREMDRAQEYLYKASTALVAGREVDAQEHIRAAIALGYSEFEELFFDAHAADQILYSAAVDIADACWWREGVDKGSWPLEPWSWVPAVIHTSREDLDGISARATRYALRFAGLDRTIEPVGRAVLGWAHELAPHVEAPEDAVVDMLLAEDTSREPALLACVRASIWLHYQAGLIRDQRETLRIPSSEISGQLNSALRELHESTEQSSPPN